MKKKDQREALTLKQYFKKYGLLQNCFADRVGASPASLSRIINLGYAPSLKLALAIEKETKGEVPITSWDLSKGAHCVNPEHTNNQKSENGNS